MEGERTIPEVVINSYLNVYRVESITFIPGDKIVKVRCWDENNMIQDLTADVSDEWTALSATKKADWKAMFKKAVAIAIGVAANEITGDIWD